MAHSVIEAVAVRAEELRLAADRRRFADDARAFVAALMAVRESRLSGCTGADLDRLVVVVEQAIEIIERRIAAGYDRPAVQQQLVEDVYGIRVEMEEIVRWWKIYSGVSVMPVRQPMS